MKKSTHYTQKISSTKQFNFFINQSDKNGLQKGVLRFSVLIAAMFCMLNAQGQTTYTFKGTFSENWTDILNWDPFTFGIPQPGDIVIIDPDPLAPYQDVILNDNSTIKSLNVRNGSLTVNPTKNLTINTTSAYALALKVESGGQLIVESGGTLTVNQGFAFGLRNYGTVDNSGVVTIVDADNDGVVNEDLSTFNNLGILNILEAFNHGVRNQGTFNNSGGITIKNVFYEGIRNRSIFNNNAGGTINVSKNARTHIENETGTFTNAGSISIKTSQSSLESSNGLINRSTFNNNAGGSVQIEDIDFNGIINLSIFNNSGNIQIDETDKSGIYNVGGTVTNSATITIGENKAIGLYGIWSKGNFNNSTGGNIQIDQTGNIGLLISSHSFTNEGNVSIGKNKTVGREGIWNARTLINKPGGIIEINKTWHEGIFCKGTFSTVTNYGEIIIGELSRPGRDGIQNESSFTNEFGGEILIKSAGHRGIFNGISATLFENKGKIEIENTVHVEGLFSVKPFTNEVCGILTVEGALNNSNTFTNKGLATFNTSNLHENTGTFTNDGILHHIEDNPIPTVTNNEIILEPITSADCSPISSVFNLGNPVNFNILGVFKDASGINSAGTYDVNTNTFTPNPILPEGSHDLFVKIEDGTGGCTRIVSWKLTIDNTINPEAKCQDKTVQLDANGDANITASEIDNGSTDNCGIASLGLDQTDFDCNDVGDVTVTLTVTNINGNSETCTATVTVEDNIKPNAQCQNATVELDSNGDGSITTSDIDNNSTDNCAIDTFELDKTDFDCDDLGANTVTLTVTDENNNEEICTATVSVEDNLKPEITCPSNISKSMDSGTCSAVVTWVTPSASDNCDVDPTETQTMGDSSGSAFLSGVHTIEYKAEDEEGNEEFCQFTVTVEGDSEKPNAQCQNATVELNANGNSSITTSDIDNNSTDNCAIDTYELDKTDFDCDDVGEVTVTLTVTDESGNSDDCTATVSVEDNLKPNTQCQNKTIELDSNGDGSITASDIDNNSTDNCAIDTYELDKTDFDCDDVGEVTVTLTVTDENGNLEDCTATVTVEDNLKPEITCPSNITKSMDVGACSAVVTWTTPSASDNCDADPTETQTIGDPSGSAFSSGVHTIEYKAEDAQGNEQFCQFTVTVEGDSEKPVLTNCPSNISQSMDAGQCEAVVTWSTPTATDNCDVNPVVSQTLGNSSGNSFSEGTHSIEYKATDSEGNESTACSFTITVLPDDEKPILNNCPPNITQAMDAGQCGAIVNWTSPSATDNCDANPTVSQTSGQTSGSLFNEGTHSIEYKAIDTAGNESDLCSFSITVEGDTEKPNFNGTCPTYPTAFNTDANECYSTINFTLPNPSDNCGVTELKAKIWDSNNNVVQNWTTNPDGQYAPDTYQIKWRAKDVAGNKKTCAKNFTVQDAQNPDAQCVASHVVQLSGGSGSISTADIDAASSDNCNFNLSLSKTNFNCNDRGNTTVILTITDDAGNTDQCITNVEVKGTTLTINDLSNNEGNGTGFSFFFFKIERGDNGCALQVDYETTDGDATLADNDYVYGSGTAYYPPGGSNIRYVICRGIKDSNYESDEDFWVEMSNPTIGVSFTKDKGEGILVNDDAAPLIGNSNNNSVFQNANAQTFESKASLYPNPVARDLNISIPSVWLEEESIQVALLDILGKRIAAFEMSEDHSVVDVSALMAGTYQVVFTTKDGERTSEKFIKVD